MLETFRKLREEGADSLIILTKADIKSVSLKLLRFLAPGKRKVKSLLNSSIGRNFVIFHEYLEPLSNLRDFLENGEMAIGVRVIDLWFRKYQILLNRTHPEVKMNGASGYVLFGTKIVSDEIH